MQHHLLGLGRVDAKDYDKLEVIEYEVQEKETKSIGLKLTSKGIKDTGVTKYKGTVYALLNRGY